MATLNEKKECDGKVTFSLEGYEVVTRIAKANGNTARVNVPVSWVGCDVALIRLSKKIGGGI